MATRTVARCKGSCPIRWWSTLPTAKGTSTSGSPNTRTTPPGSAPSGSCAPRRTGGCWRTGKKGHPEAVGCPGAGSPAGPCGTSESQFFAIPEMGSPPISGASCGDHFASAARARPASATARYFAALASTHGYHNDSTPVRLPYVLSPPAMERCRLRQNNPASLTTFGSSHVVCSFKELPASSGEMPAV